MHCIPLNTCLWFCFRILWHFHLSDIDAARLCRITETLLYLYPVVEGHFMYKWWSRSYRIWPCFCNTFSAKPVYHGRGCFALWCPCLPQAAIMCGLAQCPVVAIYWQKRILCNSLELTIILYILLANRRHFESNINVNNLYCYGCLIVVLSGGYIIWGIIQRQNIVRKLNHDKFYILT